MAAIPELDRSLESAYRAHYPALFRRARRWLPPDEAEDLVQETFLRAWMHHGGSNPGVPWLMTVLRNLAIDRSRRIHPDLTDDPGVLDASDGADATAEKVVALEDRRRVREALASLTAQQRAVITLREWAGMSQQEIADSLGTTVPSVESLLLRGRRRLKNVLGHAMAAVLWPASELWRKLKGGLVAHSAGGAGAAPGLSTVAGLATAATVIAAGAAAPLGPARGAPPPPRDPIVLQADDGSTVGVRTTPTEEAAGSGGWTPKGGTVGSGGTSGSGAATVGAAGGGQSAPTSDDDGSRLPLPKDSDADDPTKDRASDFNSDDGDDKGPATNTDDTGPHSNGDENPTGDGPPTVGIDAPAPAASAPSGAAAPDSSA